MSDLVMNMILYTLGIFLFSCGIQPSILKMIPDFPLNFFEVGIIGTILTLGTGYLLNFIQRHFFDKKHIENTSVLDYDTKLHKRVSDYKLWPYKLGLIFSGVLMLWFLMISFQEI